MPLTFVVAAFFVFCFNTASALTFTESFTSTAQKNASGTTAVWNFELGILHPTLIVSGVQIVGPPSVSQTVVVGDGSDGPFNNTTYANFGTVVGSTITIDASLRPILFVSSFVLDAGMILTAVNGPLIVYSLSTVDINGTIQCSGIAGFPAVTTTGGLGGPGRCGGFSGGAGGNQFASGSSGNPVAGAVTGGGGGTYAGVNPGGGGGGAGSFSGNSGNPGVTVGGNTGGAAGSGTANFQFTNLGGSPGGGGGSGSDTEGGGGGGGGGGTVVIHAVGDVSISATGAIYALGGMGGASSTGGGGGGGAGGSIKIITAEDLELDSGTPVDVTGGLGNLVPAGDGGSGSFGRTWLVYTTFTGIGNESHGSGLANTGTIEYETVLRTAETNTYDTASTLPIFSSITSNPANGDITLEIAGSTDNFAADDSGWLPAASIATLNNKRYIKFRLNLTNSNPTTPTVVNDVTITYTLGTPPSPGPGPTPTPSPSATPELKENFQFQSGCGRIENINNGGPFQFLTLLLLGLPFIVAIFLKCRDLNVSKI